jgi:hypothetical protein
MRRSPLQTVLLTSAETQELCSIFRMAADSTVRGVISWRDGFVQAQVFHGLDHKDNVTFTYDAPGAATRPPVAAKAKTHFNFDPDDKGRSYSFRVEVTFEERPVVVLDYNGRPNRLARPSPYTQGHPQYATQLGDMKLALAEYAVFHRAVMDARGQVPPGHVPPKGKPGLKLV